MAVSSFANPQTLNNDLTLTFGLVGALSTAVSIATVVIAVHRYMQSRGTTAERSDDVEMQRHSVDSSDGGHDRNEDEPNDIATLDVDDGRRIDNASAVDTDIDHVSASHTGIDHTNINSATANHIVIVDDTHNDDGVESVIDGHDIEVGSDNIVTEAKHTNITVDDDSLPYTKRGS